MKSNPTFADYQGLLTASSFRDFLSEALKFHYRNKDKVNYADFSRRAGFSSRSFLSELLSGKKGLSKGALKQIQLTLKLSRELSKILELKAYKDFPDIKPKEISLEDIDEAIHLCKIAIEKKFVVANLALQDRKKLLRSPSSHQIYAALGTIDEGATWDEIKKRTNLSDEAIERYLNILSAAKLITPKNFRFFPAADQLDLFGLSTQDGLSDLIQAAAQDLAKKTTQAIQEPNNLVFYSAFSTDSSRLPQLRARLKEAIFTVLDEFHEDKGDTVRQVLMSFRGL